MADFKNSTLLVTGASGQFGRLAVEELLARGATKLIAGTRDPAKLADLVARGVEVRQLDFDDKASLAAGFAGIERVLLISTDAVGNRVAQHKNAVEAAKAAGVKHVVYTSAPNPRPNPGTGVSPEHYWTEVAIAAAGLDFTFLRNHIYAEISLRGAAPAIGSGQLYDATNGGGRSYVTRADAARTAAGALLTAQGQAIFDVTGPVAVTQAELAAEFAKASGKPVARVGLSGEQLRGGLIAAGLPEGMADVMVAFDVDAADGYHAVVTDTVEQFSGRKPETLTAFLEANRAALVG
ncbi:SDR family oxidoreductase [Devosia neptuniae]|uniref:SDR family oxidoreductase n=1 Tax=Devosia neptuniae TaxID=191302 RepID=A0ABY6CBW6_9HYPH|nr:SDR family oxidoreductase [Devosia neptuniae]UXN69625.1 SDR family oxidoreductase [Devosia neptuniae]